MSSEPPVKRVISFIDGQNLYRSAKDAFGYSFPNYDVQKLSAAICKQQGWTLAKICFYTGIPDVADDVKWHEFWSRKLAVMGTRGIQIYSRKLRYRNQEIRLPDGSVHTFLVGQEKGVDIRIALDVVQSVHRGDCDVALIFSQDQDLSEVADEVRRLAKDSGRWLKVASAFPVSPTTRNKRGIDKTDWIKIDKTLYDGCIDPLDYRKPPGNTP